MRPSKQMFFGLLVLLIISIVSSQPSKINPESKALVKPNSEANENGPRLQKRSIDGLSKEVSVFLSFKC